MRGKGKTGGKRSARAADDLALDLPVPAEGEPLAMPFCRIPAGEFRMGARSGSSDEEPRHLVTVAEEYWLGKHVVTQGEYRQVVRGLGLAGTKRQDGETWNESPSKQEGSDRLPVERVSWDDARLWCEALSAWLDKEGSPWRVRLPTEIEWEYACRGGTETEYWNGDDKAALADVAWIKSNSGGRTHAVDDPLSPASDRPEPNAFGLVGMDGNVWEWGAGVWPPYNYLYRADGCEWRGFAWGGGDDEFALHLSRVVRGGCWGSPGCGSAFRFRCGP
ncbi:MAG: formylglycine-generating enzyme family protein, partial [Planctomycetia bacterium]